MFERASRVFLVSRGRLAAYRWQRGRVEDPLLFLADEDGLTQFALYLQHEPDEPARILVDAVEEEFRADTIPHVLGGDRRALVRNKLSRLFRDATYSHAIFQGREAAGRRDDRVLFAALIRPDLLTPWVALINQYRVRLAGIYSLPILSQGLVKPLEIDSGQVLLVTQQAAGSLRQTFFRDGQLKLSRLAVLPRSDPRAQASHVLGEVERVRRYLNSLRLLAQDVPLEVHLVARDPLLTDVRRQAPDSLTTRHHLVAVEDAAVRIGMKGSYASPYADRLFVHWLARHPPGNHYAAPAQTRYHRLGQIRTAMRVASVALLVGVAGWSGVRALEGLVAARETETVRAQAAFFRERYRVASERLPPAPADSRGLEGALEAAAALERYRTSPLDMMRTLSAGLEAFTSLRIEDIAWVASTDPEGRVGDSAPARRPTLEEMLGGTRARRESDTLYQLAAVKGRVQPFDGDYRAALELIGRFADRLREQPGVETVEVISLPLDIGSERRLLGDAGADMSQSTAGFELRVVLRVGGAGAA
jgi:hypothetical protein